MRGWQNKYSLAFCLRTVTLFAALTASLILCLRAAIGPFTFGALQVHSALPAEEIFSLSVIALLLAGGKTASAFVQISSDHSGRPPLLPLAAALCLIVLMFSWNLTDPFLSDDYILVSRASVHDLHLARRFLTPGGDGAFRPIGGLYFDLASIWAEWSPWRCHLCGLALHVVNCGLLYFLIWNLWSNSFIAVSAALLFGLHGTRPEVVVWTAGNFDALASCWVLLTLLCIFRTDARFPLSSLTLASACFVLALLSKESAYATPVLVLGLGFASDRFAGATVRRAFVSTTLLSIAALIYRWVLFRGPGGYVDPATGRPAILSMSLVSTAKALVVRLWSILFFPLNWQAHQTAFLVPAALLICVTSFGLIYTQRAARKVIGSLLLTTAAALLPAIHLALIGDDALGSRILYLPSLGFCILWAYMLGSIQSPPVRQIGLALVVACLMLSLAHNLAAWHEVAITADRTCAQAAATSAAPARASLPRTLQGVFFFANGFPECLSMKREAAIMKQCASRFSCF